MMLILLSILLITASSSDVNDEDLFDSHTAQLVNYLDEFVNIPAAKNWTFHTTISREVLLNYLARSVSIEGLLNGKGDLKDNIRMLGHMGAKYLGRSLCLWGMEANLTANIARAKDQVSLVRQIDQKLILEAAIFEIVTTEVNLVQIPEWAFEALGESMSKRNFSYEDMLYTSGKFVDHWGRGKSVPDVSRVETKLWFYFLARTYIDLGFEAIHHGQVELMNQNDPHLDHFAQLFDLYRQYARGHARRAMILLNAHVPSGGLVRDGQLLLDFHAFPLRVKEEPDRPFEAILELRYKDSIYGRSKGGLTYSGWTCEHLPYLVELDNYGVSSHPGHANQTEQGFWVWGYDEITWFAHQNRTYRAEWLEYAFLWLNATDPNGRVQMPAGRTEASPLDHKNWYFANDKSESVPDGLGDEEAVHDIWQKYL